MTFQFPGKVLFGRHEVDLHILDHSTFRVAVGIDVDVEVTDLAEDTRLVRLIGIFEHDLALDHRELLFALEKDKVFADPSLF